MSRHFFHLRERGGRLHPDDCGVDLPDAEAAYEEALLGARGLMDDAALARRGGDVYGQSFEVTDADGNAAFTLPFWLAVDDEPRRVVRRRAAPRPARPQLN
jgi:uncharacterized protein DUF6894